MDFDTLLEQPHHNFVSGTVRAGNEVALKCLLDYGKLYRNLKGESIAFHLASKGKETAIDYILKTFGKKILTAPTSVKW